MSLFFARKESAAEANEEGAGIYLSELPVDRIAPNPDQPRRAFSEKSISAASSDCYTKGHRIGTSASSTASAKSVNGPAYTK